MSFLTSARYAYFLGSFQVQPSTACRRVSVSACLVPRSRSSPGPAQLEVHLTYLGRGRYAVRPDLGTCTCTCRPPTLWLGSTWEAIRQSSAPTRPPAAPSEPRTFPQNPDRSSLARLHRLHPTPIDIRYPTYRARPVRGEKQHINGNKRDHAQPCPNTATSNIRTHQGPAALALASEQII